MLLEKYSENCEHLEHSYSKSICQKCCSLEAEIIRLKGQLSYERREHGKIQKLYKKLKTGKYVYTQHKFTMYVWDIKRHHFYLRI